MADEVIQLIGNDVQYNIQDKISRVFLNNLITGGPIDLIDLVDENEFNGKNRGITYNLNKQNKTINLSGKGDGSEQYPTIIRNIWTQYDIISNYLQPGDSIKIETSGLPSYPTAPQSLTNIDNILISLYIQKESGGTNINITSSSQTITIPEDFIRATLRIIVPSTINIDDNVIFSINVYKNLLNNFIRYDLDQELTSEQQTRVCTNIGAIAEAQAANAFLNYTSLAVQTLFNIPSAVSPAEEDYNVNTLFIIDGSIHKATTNIEIGDIIDENNSSLFSLNDLFNTNSSNSGN